MLLNRAAKLRGPSQRGEKRGGSIRSATARAPRREWAFARHEWQPQQPRGVVCRSTIDDPELEGLVRQMEAMRPPLPARREKLEKAIKMIDDINANDPMKVPFEGRTHPYRVLYSNWVAGWAQQLDPKAPDELLLLAKGRNVEGWKLAEIKRDDYPPSSGGQRMWEGDRKRWQAARLTGIMREAGYEDGPVGFVEEVMMDRDIPDPRDIRRFDLVGPLGSTNFRILEAACIIQTLRDAEALVFMERNFPQMFDRMTADEVLAAVKKELSKVSNKCMSTLLAMRWPPVQRKLLQKAWTPPKRFGTILGELEGVAAASTHPGDWRYKDFDYD